MSKFEIDERLALERLEIGQKPLMAVARKRGKPRRAKKLAERTEIKLDPDAKEALRREFGSIGNACFWLYQGIQKMANEIAGEPVYKDLAHSEHRLNIADAEVILEALKYYYEQAGNIKVRNGGGRLKSDIQKVAKKITAAIKDEQLEARGYDFDLYIPKRRTS